MTLEEEKKRNETVRETLERVAKEQGVYKEPKVMHTDIGDFSYYDDDSNGGNLSGTGASFTTSPNQTPTPWNSAVQPQTTPTPWNGTAQSQTTADYTVNTESLAGKPSSYFQNDNSVVGFNNNSSFLNNNTGALDNNYTISTNTTIGQPSNRIQSDASNDIPRYWENSADGKKVYDYMMQQEGNFTLPIQRPELYQYSAFSAVPNMIQNYFKLKPLNVTDKYKHAYMNCSAAQYGQGGADIATLASNLREWYDKKSGANTLDSSEGDQYANRIGRFLGSKYPEEDCDELVQRYINRRY